MSFPLKNYPAIWWRSFTRPYSMAIPSAFSDAGSHPISTSISHSSDTRALGGVSSGGRKALAARVEGSATSTLLPVGPRASSGQTFAQSGAAKVPALGRDVVTRLAALRHAPLNRAPAADRPVLLSTPRTPGRGGAPWCGLICCSGYSSVRPDLSVDFDTVTTAQVPQSTFRMAVEARLPKNCENYDDARIVPSL